MLEETLLLLNKVSEIDRQTCLQVELQIWAECAVTPLHCFVETAVQFMLS